VPPHQTSKRASHIVLGDEGHHITIRIVAIRIVSSISRGAGH